MERYKNIPKIDGKYKTIRFPKIIESENDVILITKDSDRLDLFAKQYYNDETLFWIIALANNIGKGTVEIEPGTQIRIPSDYSNIVREYLRLNS